MLSHEWRTFCLRAGVCACVSVSECVGESCVSVSVSVFLYVCVCVCVCGLL